MKQLMQLLIIAVVSVVSLNVGVAWGITSKPVLDTDKCNHIIRYEDMSLECRITLEDAPDGTVIGATIHNPPLEVSDRTGTQIDSTVLQDGDSVQPTTDYEYQPTEQTQETTNPQVTRNSKEVQ